VATPRYLNLSRSAVADPDEFGQRPTDRPTGGDRTFRTIATIAAATSLLIVGGTLFFLIRQARPALESAGIGHFFVDHVWNPATGHFGVSGLMLGTLIIAGLALFIAVPLGLGLALFINEYAPARIRRALTSVVDLLAALPSLVFGIWGLFALQGRLVPVARWMGAHLSAIPLFRLSSANELLVQSSFVAAVVVAIMILPIITSVSRDVMAQVPRELCEGALALGGTRWGMIRDVILPFGRSGIVGATLLGFGRALGETIAVALLVSLQFDVNWHVLQSKGGSIASLIAVKFNEAGPLEQSALVAAGLALFLLTLVVNLVARRIVARAHTV
jgi:phosphate transport system permease protein